MKVTKKTKYIYDVLSAVADGKDDSFDLKEEVIIDSCWIVMLYYKSKKSDSSFYTEKYLMSQNHALKNIEDIISKEKSTYREYEKNGIMNKDCLYKIEALKSVLNCYINRKQITRQKKFNKLK